MKGILIIKIVEFAYFSNIKEFFHDLGLSLKGKRYFGKNVIPQDLIDYLRAFSFGFLITMEKRVPNIELVDFEVQSEHIAIKSKKEIVGKGCLVLANKRYSENSAMVLITGDLLKDERRYNLVPTKAFWTLPFSLDSYPKRIIKRWHKV